MAKIQTSDGYMLSKNKHLEGFSPIYKNGKITPDTQGLGPQFKKDIKMEKMPLQPKKKIEPLRKLKKLNIKNLA